MIKLNTNPYQKGIFIGVAAVMLSLIMVNTFLIAFTFNSINDHYTTEETQLDRKQVVAREILEHNREFASRLGVKERMEVRESLAEFNYEIEVAPGSEDLTSLIINQGRRLQELILGEGEAALQDEALSIVNRDENVGSINNPGRIILEFDEEKEVVLVTPEEALKEESVSRLHELFKNHDLGRSQLVEIEIREGEGSLLPVYDPEELHQSLNEEIDDLRLTMRELRVEAGFDEMRDEGVKVILRDGENAVTSDALIHDSDVRNVVNELFSSGARGVSVGGERLTATSYIRYVGSLIKVDDKQVPIPVEIEAVGDPDILSSGLKIIENEMIVNRGIGFEVVKKDEVILPAK